MYLGQLEIKSIEENGDKVKLKLKGESYIPEINKELFDKIKSENKGKGNITDVVNHYFAMKFVAELAYYDMEFYMVDGIGMAMKVLVHNLREELLRKTFNCTGGDAIKLSELLKDEKV